MRSSVLVAAGAASLAIGSPLEKRKMETSWVVQYDTVTVTDGETEAAKPTPFWGAKQPADEPTSTSIPVVIVTATPVAPAVQPTAVQPSVVIVTESPSYQQPTTPEPVVEAPSSSPIPTSSAPSGTDFPSVAVQHHNIHRSNHSSPEVAWSDKLAGYAANTASSCKMAHDMDQGDKNYGQNLANWGQSSGAYELGDVGAVKMAITDMWYNGEFAKFLPEFYGQATPPMSDFESWGHFSQLLWKGSNEVGCAAQFCEKGTMYTDMDAWFTVCNYGPPGNVGGSYGSDLFQPLGLAIEIA
ncbi:PR-1-like protein [Jackrogersella minutella]|nr:PR-1-like protein [Jackrogersella minutella]